MKPEELEHYRGKLISLRSRLRGDVNMMAQETFARENGEDNAGRPAGDIVDIGSESYEQEITFGRLSSDGERLNEIEAALERIQSGEYGACLECEGRIPKARLDVLPDTPYCVKCASQLER